jgi:lysophospholipid acyltransferase (LPLAT)-like uncharacterized protein
VSTVTTPPAPARVSREPADYTRWQRVQIWVIAFVGTVAIRLIGMTLRFSVFIEDGGPPTFNTHPLILCFWHRAIFISTYAFRNQGIGVITSESFDGEYIARVISNFGYEPVRGSSSRGGLKALLSCRRLLEQQRTVAATTDGPRGPVFVAKPGPVLLAKQTGISLVAFHIALEDPWTLSTWDRFMIPKPFTRALLCVGKQIPVPPDIDSAEADKFHAELQAAQERVRDFAEANVRHVGGPAFPLARI